MEKHCLSLLVENNFGVLSRISGLFARRGYNIDSLTVGVTDDERVSRITMVVTADEATLEQIKKQLNKLINVIKVIELKPDDAIRRELVFIKVRASDQSRCLHQNDSALRHFRICSLRRHGTSTRQKHDCCQRINSIIAWRQTIVLSDVNVTTITD